MAFEVVAASYQERERQLTPLQRTVVTGLIFGFVCLYFALVGILLTFHGRWVVVDVLTLGQAVLGLCVLLAGVEVARRAKVRRGTAILLQGLAAGAVAGALPALLVLIMSVANLRHMLIALSPPLLEMLSFGLAPAVGAACLVAAGAIIAAVGAMLYIAPPTARRAIAIGLSLTAFIGLFQDLFQLMLRRGDLVGRIGEMLFTWDGLRPEAAIGLFIVGAAGTVIWIAARPPLQQRYRQMEPTTQQTLRLLALGIGLGLILLFPLAGGAFAGQVFMLIGLYVLMGMGLNIEVGLAGLLDLGFVAFYAIGAYTVALLTADSPLAIAALPFWVALPIAVIMAVAFGVLFGVPVLGVRGDYLAVATLGLGEIVRVLVLSDTAAPLLGGAQGILNIPSPTIGDLTLDNPVKLYFLTVACAGVAAFFAWRLQDSRLGRAWTAIRDDEDAGQALGINLVGVKLMAYGIGAAFAGLAGAIFAVMLTSIFPHSFQLLISINILALIIVGGLGSLRGVAVGALALIGLPEMLREFGEYRYLFYGAVIVAMMRLKPEGLWPAAARRREARGDNA